MSDQLQPGFYVVQSKDWQEPLYVLHSENIDEDSDILRVSGPYDDDDFAEHAAKEIYREVNREIFTRITGLSG